LVRSIHGEEVANSIRWVDGRDNVERIAAGEAQQEATGPRQLVARVLGDHVALP